MITRYKAFAIVLSSTIGLVLTSHSALAQSGTKSYGSNRISELTNRTGASRFSSKFIRDQLTASSVTRVRAAGSNLGAYKPTSSSFNSKPFSSISRKPTVSPYLALNNSFNQVSDYYNIVRPQREQQQVNQQLQRQNQANQRRLNQMAAKGPYSTRGDENSAPTGHTAVFQSLGTYLNTGGYFSGSPVPRP